MVLARALLATIVCPLGLALSGCAAPAPPRPRPPVERVVAPPPEVAPASATARMPNEIRSGFAEMVVQRVEREVSRDEVAAAVQSMITASPICMRWPALWIETQGRNVFVVRYDLMARDWGESAAGGGEARLDEFVAMGYLTKRILVGRSVEYTLTPQGRARLSGVIESGQRPTFCAPAERRLVEITNMEWVQNACGSLRVSFTHVGDDWPSWAQSAATRDRLAASWPAIGTPTEGSVSLSRQWYRPRDLPSGARNGALRSLCLDASRAHIVGDDLNLAVTPLE